jgi:hypothetical protein
MNTDAPRGIAGLEGRESFGAALTVGRKDDQRGFPIEKDRFHVVWPVEDERGRRPAHPAFRRFTEAPVEHRRTALGQLVHARRAECFEYSLGAQVLPGKPQHPGRIKACRGDGVRAVRWDGSRFVAMPCPAEQCEYRQTPAKGKSPCGPSMRFAFRLCWPEKVDLPTPLAKFTSGSWNTIKGFIGFFDAIQRAADALGFSDYSLAGFRFVLTLTERTNRERQSRFPVVLVTPMDDPVAFLLRQVEQRQLVAGRPLVPLLVPPVAALTDPEQQTGDAIAADYRQHVPGLGPVDAEDQQ